MSRLLKFGVIGTIITALCCFTPVLVALLGIAGISAYVDKLDIILFPLLLIFVVITGYALWKK